jgi:hypothetical protein
MIRADIKTMEAVICCDECLMELSRGRYPEDASDNIGPEHFIVSGGGDNPDEHYCNACHSHLTDHLEFPNEL